MKNSVQKGSITVFLSLILMLLISVVTTSLESAHLAAVRSQIGMASEASVYNLFSRFEKSLYEQYELLFLNDRQDLDTILESEMKFYEASNAKTFGGTNHLSFSMDSVEIHDTTYLMDQNGEAFQKEINQILSADMISMVKQSISGYVKQLSQSGTVTEYMNEIMEQSLPLADMTEQVMNAAESSGTVAKGIGDLKDTADECEKTMNSYQSLLKDAGWDESESSGSYLKGELEIRKALKNQLEEMNSDKKKLEKELKQALEELEAYEEAAQVVTENLDDVKKGLQNEDLEDSYKEALYEELKSVLNMTSESGDWYQQIHQAKENVEKNLQMLQSADIPDPDTISREAIQNGTLEKRLNQAVDIFNECKKVDIPVTEKTVESKAGFSAKSLLRTVQTLITQGAFSIIVDNQKELSDRKVDMKEFPSAKQAKEKVDSGKNIFDTVVDNTKDTLALNTYLTEYMPCYTDGGYYDLEYILGDKTVDKENLKSTVNQLILLRQAMNLVYLLTDSGKRTQAQTAATGMLAITGNGVLIQGMTMILLTAWAYAEAVSDVKILVDGGKVGFVKNSKNWRLSLEQAANYQNWSKQAANQDTTKQAGLEYKEYLRILLFFHSRNVNMFRGLDMIQWNICQNDSGFRISQCIYEIEADFSMCVKPVFMSAVNMGLTQDGYAYEHKETQNYG